MNESIDDWKEDMAVDNSLEFYNNNPVNQIRPGTMNRRPMQSYRKAWEQFPEFSDWLRSHENMFKAQCTLCSKILTSDLTVIRSHASSKKHMLLEVEYNKAKEKLKMLSSSSAVQQRDILNDTIGYLAVAGEYLNLLGWTKFNPSLYSVVVLHVMSFRTTHLY
jgi:hypothetical protein